LRLILLALPLIVTLLVDEPQAYRQDARVRVDLPRVAKALLPLGFSLANDRRSRILPPTVRCGEEGRVVMRKQKAEDAGIDQLVTREADYASVGTHVASVLEAATSAADRLREDAERDATAKIADASARAGEIVHDAEALKAEAEETAKRVTERAEAFAERRRKDADAEAAAILENAEQVARRQHEEMTARQEALGESIALAETRLRDLVGGLRRLADQLEAVISAESLKDWTEPTATLDDALRESVRSE